ncbi:MAG: efflux RND transporter periplasmic adaptor subunit [Bacteroidales bacterium]
MKVKRSDILKGTAMVIIGLLLGALLFGLGGEDPEDSKTTGEEVHDNEDHGDDSTEYTCSMHPQIREDEPGDCPICGMELIPADEEESEQEDPTEFTLSETAAKLAEIQTTRVTMSIPEKQVHLTGKIVVDERRIASQPVHFPGRIEKLYLNFKGERVYKEQKLAEIYSPELISAQEELLEALKNRSPDSDMVEAAKDKLRQWKLTEEQIDEIIQENEVREVMTIRSDTEGIVHEKLVNTGDYVQKGALLYQIASLDRLWVIFDAYQEDLQFISHGDSIEFKLSSLPGKAFQATVEFVDPVMDGNSRIARIRAEVKNSSGNLKPGMFVEGEIQGRVKNAESEKITVPKSAVMWTGKRSVVYLKSEKENVPSYKLREVVLGPSLGEQYIIEKGLEVDDEIVTHGAFVVDAAAQLKGKPSMMNEAGGDPHKGHDHGEMNEETQEQEEYSENNTTSKDLEWPASEKAKYDRMVQAYINLKNRLVEGETVNEEAGKILSAAKEVEMGKFSQEAHVQWMNHFDIIKETATSINDADDIEEQRNDFIELSEAMIELVKNFNTPETEEKLFVQFCPMADNDKGAFWISEENQIRNPYFGDAMLTCGEVKEELE